MSDVVEDMDDYCPPFEFRMADGRLVRFIRMGMEQWISFTKKTRAIREQRLNEQVNAELEPEEWQKRTAARAAIAAEIRNVTTIHTLMDEARFDPETILSVLRFSMLDIEKPARAAVAAVAAKAGKPGKPAKDGKPAEPALPAVSAVTAIPEDAGFPQRLVKDDAEKSAILRRIAPIDQLTISREIVLNAVPKPLDHSRPVSNATGAGGPTGGNGPPAPSRTGEASGEKSKSSGPDSASGG